MNIFTVSTAVVWGIFLYYYTKLLLQAWKETQGGFWGIFFIFVLLGALYFFVRYLIPSITEQTINLWVTMNPQP
jgi:hypothetical protein